MDLFLLHFFLLYPQNYFFSKANLSLFQHAEKSPFLCYVKRSGLMAMWGLKGWCQLPTEKMDGMHMHMGCAWDAPLAGHEVSESQPSASDLELCDRVQYHSPSPIHSWWTLEPAGPWGHQVGFNLAFLTIGYLENLMSQLLSMLQLPASCEVQQTLGDGIRKMRVKRQKNEVSFWWHSEFSNARDSWRLEK